MKELSSFVSCFLTATEDVGLLVAQFCSMVLGAIKKTLPDSAPSTIVLILHWCIVKLILHLIELRFISFAAGP